MCPHLLANLPVVAHVLFHSLCGGYVPALPLPRLYSVERLEVLNDQFSWMS
jgi:hypothetical protein